MCVCIFADDRLLWGNHWQTHGHTCATLWLIWVALNSQARHSQLLLFFEVSRLWAALPCVRIFSPGDVTIFGSAEVSGESYLVDPASSHMLVSKIKPCMSKYKLLIL